MMKKMPKIRILASYHYIDRSRHFDQCLQALKPQIACLVDSGAFTDFNKTRKALVKGERYDKITVEKYSGWLKAGGADMAWKYIALDRIGDRSATLRNYEYMRENGLKPMPVLIIGEDVELVKRFVKDGCDWVCMAGSVKGSDTYVAKRLYDIQEASEGKLKVHALGFGRWPDIFRLPLHSGDSVTAFTGGIYGIMAFYSRQYGMVTARKNTFHKKPREVQSRLLGQLRKFQITPDMLRNDAYYRTMRSIPCFTMIYAFLRFMEHAAEKHIHYWIAVTSAGHMRYLAAVLHGVHGDNWSYPESLEKMHELDAMWKSDKQFVMENMLPEIFERKTEWKSMWK